MKPSEQSVIHDMESIDVRIKEIEKLIETLTREKGMLESRYREYARILKKGRCTP